MKRSILMTTLLLFFILSGNINIQAQDRTGNNRNMAGQIENNDNSNQDPGMYCKIPGLTDSQRETINKMRLEHQKTVKQMHAAIGEKRAHLNTLRLADKYNKSEVNATIDDIASLRADLMKANEAHRQSVRAELNDEQKAWFDSRPHRQHRFGRDDFDDERPGFRHNRGMRQGNGYPGCDGMGPGWGR